MRNDDRWTAIDSDRLRPLPRAAGQRHPAGCVGRDPDIELAALRRKRNGKWPTPGAAPPFVPWDYRPAYLPAGLSIDMACNSGVLGEPLLFQVDRPFTPFGVAHALHDRRLTRVVVTVPLLAPMSILREVQVPGLEFRDGDAALLELTLAPTRGNTIDLRPQLPLVLHC